VISKNSPLLAAFMNVLDRRQFLWLCSCPSRSKPLFDCFPLKIRRLSRRQFKQRCTVLQGTRVKKNERQFCAQQALPPALPAIPTSRDTAVRLQKKRVEGTRFCYVCIIAVSAHLRILDDRQLTHVLTQRPVSPWLTLRLRRQEGASERAGQRDGRRKRAEAERGQMPERVWGGRTV